MKADDLAHVAFLGEREERFLLTPALITELEAVLDLGIGSIFKRLGAGHFKHAEITQTLRLALIGGGMKAEQAARLVAVYVAPMPIIESLPIALSILEILWFGKPLVQAVALEALKGANHAA